MKKNILRLVIIFSLQYHCASYTRSVHRPQDPTLPEISVRWGNDLSTQYILKDSHLEEYPIFKIKADDSYNYFLPTGAISFRDNPEQSVETDHLKKLIEELLIEIQAGKSSYTHFKVLRKNDFNRRKRCGLLIAKFKEYPFVLKLSIEQPDSFTAPFCKGIVPTFSFFMAGGSNRHLTGLTRILNLERVSKQIKNHPYWASRVKMPRKWFWLPENCHWLEITGKNIGDYKTISTKLPSVYGIIADAIETDKECTTISKKTKYQSVIRLCNDLDGFLDPNMNNFVFQLDPKTQKPSIVLIDTEHFPSIVGLKRKYYFRNHVDWIAQLAHKCLNDMFFRTKKQRRESQSIYSDLALF